MQRSVFFLCFCLFFAAFPILAAETGSVACQKTDLGYSITIDGKPFAEYRHVGEPTPILWPLYAPGGELATRAYPMIDHEKEDSVLKAAKQPAAFESRDHPHHRSVWFNFGSVNGVDFWNIGDGRPFIKCTDLKPLQTAGDTVVLESRNDWINPKIPETPVCRDVRKTTFGKISDTIWYFDYEICIVADQHDVSFGDTKEGLFSIRVSGTVEVDAKSKNPNWGGTLVNAEGNKNADAWAKRSRWIDYTGPVYVNDSSRTEPEVDAPMKTIGLTVMDHPESFRHPTWWHVRTYGLLDANPFGLTEFQAGEDGRFTVKPGESITFRYRILIHEGNLDKEQIEKLYAEYCARAK